MIDHDPHNLIDHDRAHHYVIISVVAHCIRSREELSKQVLDGCAWLPCGSGKDNLGDMQREPIRENVE